MARYLGWLANTVLFVLCCFFAAKTVNAVIGSTLVAEEGPLAAPSETQTATAPTWNDRQVILTRNLFNASLLVPANPTAVEEDLEATRLPLTLLGTVSALEPENAWAAIEHRNTKETRTVRVNDELSPGATVLRIERRRVVISENGSPRELVLSEEGELQVAAVAPGRPAMVPRPRRVPGPINRQPPPGPPPGESGSPEAPALDIRNPATLFSQARILPKYVDGQMVGVQLNAIKPGSMFHQIGIKDGDVIKELNGIKIDSPEQSAKILLEFVDAKSFNVLVENEQGTQSFTYTPD
jgi:general secretion pathway protein C